MRMAQDVQSCLETITRRKVWVVKRDQILHANVSAEAIVDPATLFAVSGDLAADGVLVDQVSSVGGRGHLSEIWGCCSRS